MSAADKNKIDELFKNGLLDAQHRFEYDARHWSDLEDLIDEQGSSRKFIYRRLITISSAAAIILLALGWWLFVPGLKPKQKIVNKPVKIKHSIANNVAKVIVPATAVSGTSNTNNPYKASQQATVIYNNNPNVSFNTAETDSGQKVLNTVTDNQTAIAVVQQTSADAAIHNSLDSEVVAANTSSLQKANPGKKAISPISPDKTRKGSRPQFAITVLASPDINGVSSFQNAKLGTNVGLVFSVGLGKRLSISTGAVYAKKPYNTDFSNYHTGYKFKVNPQQVYADCRVLDIPLDIDYKVYSKNASSFSIGTGLSSYLMLKEKYTYDYSDPAAGPASFTVRNKNRHILGVLNVNATYNHDLNTRFSLAVQPYLKIPLTNIGNSQVRLQSAGLALGLRWKFNQQKIP